MLRVKVNATNQSVGHDTYCSTRSPVRHRHQRPAIQTWGTGQPPATGMQMACTVATGTAQHQGLCLGLCLLKAGLGEVMLEPALSLFFIRTICSPNSPCLFLCLLSHLILSTLISSTLIHFILTIHLTCLFTSHTISYILTLPFHSHPSTYFPTLLHVTRFVPPPL